MGHWLIDVLAAMQGYTVCHVREEIYVHCDKDCDNCDYYINFIKTLNERSNNNEEDIEE